MAEQFLKSKPTQEIKMQNMLVQNIHPQGAGLTEWLAALNKLPAEGVHIHHRAFAELGGQGALLSRLRWNLEPLHPFVLYSRGQ